MTAEATARYFIGHPLVPALGLEPRPENYGFSGVPFPHAGARTRQSERSFSPSVRHWERVRIDILPLHDTYCQWVMRLYRSAEKL